MNGRLWLSFVMIVAVSVWVPAAAAETSAGADEASSALSAPTAAFSFVVSARSVAFTDASTGSPTGWSWSFGDGGASSLQSPSHVYAADGIFTVSLTAANADGSSSLSRSVIVSTGVTRTVGLVANSSKAFQGYTLFAPKQNHMTYLIDNDGRVVHEWNASQYPPGQAVYLLENGHLLRPCQTRGALSSGGGEGGRVEEYDWDDNLVWQLDWSTATYMQHHDIKRLPNGNTVMLVVEKKTYDEAIAAGFDPSKFQPDIAKDQMILPDSVVEVQPTGASGGTVVWEWHVWDHLIQDYDASKANYGNVSAHPELVDTDCNQRNIPKFWNHMNSIDYNPALDQIALSVRGDSEAWIIDHSTTKAEAAGHSGGLRGKGGDLLYRWGNPASYGAGAASDRRYYEQHDVEWVKEGCPGAGNLTCYNNGLGRGNGSASSVDEFVPAVDAGGNYTLAGAAFGPADFTWSYFGDAAEPLYSENISGAQRLPNGNTIICSGGSGELREVTAAGEVVWKYINPVDNEGPLVQGTAPPPDPTHPGETLNEVFRVYKYPLTYAAFAGRTLTPGDYVELPGSALVSGFSWSPAAPSPGQAVAFTDTSSGGPASWSWSFGDGASSTSQNPTHTYASAGRYAVSLTAANSAGSYCATKTVVVGSSSASPTAVFSFSPSAPAPGQAVAFTDASTGSPASWSWSFGDGAASALQNPSHAYSAPGTYTVSLTVANAQGSDTATRTLSVSAVCSISGVAAAASPFRLKVSGLNFEPGCAVLVNGQEAPETLYKSAASVVAKGAGLKALVPKGVAVNIAVRNPGGGTSAPFTFVR